MNTKTIFTFLIFLAISFLAKAQSLEQCGADASLVQMLESNPEAASKYAELQKQIQHAFNDDSPQNREVLVIPVVVHVVYRTAFENISDNEIYSQIAVLNRDFRLKNENFSVVHESFKDLAADVSIEFCLAKVDPIGNVTNGITRTSTMIDNLGVQYGPVGERRRIYYPDLGGVSAWNSKEYLNIWVCELGNVLLGQSSFPGFPQEEDGILIDFGAFGTQGMAQAPQNLGKTLVHEIGHYLNLKHIWGNDNSNCDEDDGISDTPDQESQTKDCPSSRKISCGSFDLFYDYMDYSNDACLAMFTKEQSKMMLATLRNARLGLLGQTKCNSVPLENPLAHIELRGNPAGEEIVAYLSEGNLFQVSIELFNVYGQLMFSSSDYFFPGEYPIDVRQLAQGVYFVVLSASDNRVVSKIVVAR